MTIRRPRRTAPPPILACCEAASAPWRPGGSTGLSQPGVSHLKVLRRPARGLRPTASGSTRCAAAAGRGGRVARALPRLPLLHGLRSVPFRPTWPIRNQGFVSPVAWTPDAGETFEAFGQSGEILGLDAHSVRPPRRRGSAADAGGRPDPAAGASLGHPSSAFGGPSPSPASGPAGSPRAPASPRASAATARRRGRSPAFRAQPAGRRLLPGLHPRVRRAPAAGRRRVGPACFARSRSTARRAPMSEADSLADWPEVHERYAQRFDVDPEVGRRATPSIR